MAIGGVARFLAFLLFGFLTAYLLQVLFKKLEKIEKAMKFEISRHVAETLYFAGLFSVILTRNLPLLLINFIALLYSLYGGYGKEKLPPLKPEQEADSRWYSGYP